MTDQQILAVRQHLEEEDTMATEMVVDKSMAHKLHVAANEVLAKVAKEHGFELKPSGWRFDSFTIGGRVEFVLTSAKQKLNELSNAFALDGVKVGDTVTVGMRPEQYRVESFTPRGGSHITRLKDGKKFRCKQVALKKVAA